MRKFTLTVATTLLVAACQDAMQPVPGTKPEFVAGGSDYECAGSATGFRQHCGTARRGLWPLQRNGAGERHGIKGSRLFLLSNELHSNVSV